MIRWCMYCQRFLGERAPFEDPRFSHGICESCEARSERDEAVREETEPVRVLMNQILASASAGDEHACEGFIANAEAVGLDPESVCIGMLQPALYQVGRDWQETRMSVATEHRFTHWCERVFSMLPSPSNSEPPIDLLILSAPENTHELGPRMAGRVLTARGFRVEVAVPALPFEEIVALAKTLRPRIIGFSCALSSAIPAANELIVRLRARLEPQLNCRFIVSGFAFRLGGGTTSPPIDPGIEVIVDLDALRPVPAGQATGVASP